MKKTKKAEPDLKLWTSRPGGPITWGARYKKNEATQSLNSSRGCGKLPGSQKTPLGMSKLGLNISFISNLCGGFLILGAGLVVTTGMPDKDVIRLNGPGTGRSGGIAASPGLNAGLQGGVESNPFPDEFSWGYRLVTKLEYNDVFAGINVAPKMVFSHDVQGITPDPIFLFVEDRKSLSLGLTFDYQSRWSADVSYSSFFDGVGTTNQMEDRDFVSFSVKYSI